MKSKIINNIIVFVAIPLLTIIAAAIFLTIIHNDLWKDAVDKNAITSQTESGELWEIERVTDVETAFIIYGIDDGAIEADDEYLIAFQGRTLERIEDKIDECYYDYIAISYWEGKYREHDFTYTQEFKERIQRIEESTYISDEEKIKEIELETNKFKNVRVYDVKSYMGYEVEYASGMIFAEILVVVPFIVITLIVVIAELVVALIIKLIIYMVKKDRAKKQQTNLK